MSPEQEARTVRLAVIPGDGIGPEVIAEAEKVLEWCKNKFGDGVWEDATKAWVKNSEEISKISGDMVSGGKGHRKF